VSMAKKNLTKTKQESWVKAQELGCDDAGGRVVAGSGTYALAMREFGGVGGGDDIRKGLTVPARRRRECPRDG